MEGSDGGWSLGPGDAREPQPRDGLTDRIRTDPGTVDSRRATPPARGRRDAANAPIGTDISLASIESHSDQTSGPSLLDHHLNAGPDAIAHRRDHLITSCPLHRPLRCRRRARTSAAITPVARRHASCGHERHTRVNAGVNPPRRPTGNEIPRPRGPRMSRLSILP